MFIASFYLHELIVTNFMRIRSARIKPKGRHTTIGAKNGTGKTSILDSIWVACTGPHASDIPEPIHRGENRAEIHIELRSPNHPDPRMERIILERTFKTGKNGKTETSIVATAADGTLIKHPMDLLEGMLAKYAMNPAEFLGKRPQDQLDDYLLVAGVEHPFAEVLEITGEDFPLLSPKENCYSWLTRLSADETGIFYVRRREVNRRLDEAKKAVSKQESYLATLPDVSDAEDVPALLQEDTLLAKKQNQYLECKRLYDLAKASRIDQEKLNFNLDREVDQAKARVEQLMKQLEEERKRYELLQSKQIVQADSLADKKVEEADELELLNKTPDQTPTIKALRERINRAQASQENVITRKAAETQFTTLNKEVTKYETEWKRLDQQLTRLRNLRKEVCERANLGIKGLSVGEGKLLWNDIDFKQASLAQGLRVALAIVMRQKAGLKLLRLDNAEHLDEESMNLVHEMADEHGWQVIATRVDMSKGMSIEYAGEDDDSDE